jgi:hypothetical protein
MKDIHEPMLWAFTEEAINKLNELKQLGMDADLAVAILEQSWPEERIYDLEKSS